ncbi:tRNA-binding protein [Rhizobium sp. YJ-22]|uniref:tRNA-binding protein n=1 Tax=Rhizobium sp. YJ-22 TaxID=3037556 RepID=UPI0024123793|nr:tRNA-binding protein [Rhizobium sp. YJ-22]MDG3576085.1 tRNA-binding protein [Rhizobium sp. YJ-22]
MSEEIAYSDFERVDIRVGTVVEAAPFPEARKPAIRLLIDFGPEIGVKKSSAQITVHYTPEELVGRQVMAVVNFPPRQIGPMRSEVLTLGFEDEAGAIVLAALERRVPNGRKLM